MPIPPECILGVQVSCCGCAEGKQESIAASNCIATSWAWKVCTAGEEEWYACRKFCLRPTNLHPPLGCYTFNWYTLLIFIYTNTFMAGTYNDVEKISLSPSPGDQHSCCRWAFSNNLQLCRNGYVTNMLQYDGSCMRLLQIVTVYIICFILQWWFVSSAWFFCNWHWQDGLISEATFKSFGQTWGGTAVGNGINNPLPLCSSSRTALRFDRMVYPSYAIQTSSKKSGLTVLHVGFLPQIGEQWKSLVSQKYVPEFSRHLSSLVHSPRSPRHSKASWQQLAVNRFASIVWHRSPPLLRSIQKGWNPRRRMPKQCYLPAESRPMTTFFPMVNSG